LFEKSGTTKIENNSSEGIAKLIENWLFRGRLIRIEGQTFKVFISHGVCRLTHTCKNCELVCANELKFSIL